jgi:hypothetical protein
VRALTLASIPVTYALDQLTLEQLYAVGFLSGVMTVFFDVTSAAYLPTLLAQEQLVTGNARLELSRSSAQIIGPGLAGLLIQAASAPFALLADAASFAASGALISRIRRAETRITLQSTHRLRGLGREIVEGTRYVFTHSHLRAIALTTTCANFFRSALVAVLLIYLVRDAHASAAAIGVAFAIGNVGFVTAALFAPRIARRFGIGPTMLTAVLLFGPAALLVARPALGGGLCNRGDGVSRQLRYRPARGQPGQLAPGRDTRADARSDDGDHSFPDVRHDAARDDARRRARRSLRLARGDLDCDVRSVSRRRSLCGLVNATAPRAAAASGAGATVLVEPVEERPRGQQELVVLTNE